MTATLDDVSELARTMNRGSPQARALGIAFVSMEQDRATLKLPYAPELVGDPDTGVIAGGVVTTLLDHTCGQAVWATLEIAGSIATLDLRIDYMRAAEPGRDLYATAHCYRVTRSVAFVRATAYDDDPADPVATAQAAFMLDANGGRGLGANLKDRRPEPTL